jgi:hypothetical protein
MNREERAVRAARVRVLLADRDVQTAWAEIEADLTREWRSSRTPDERENIWRAVNILDRLKVYLTSYASEDLTALRRGK